MSRWLAFLLALATAGTAMTLSLCLEDRCLPGTGPLLGTSTILSPDLQEQVFHLLTIPRTLLALLIGSVMGVAGLLIQKSLQNPFASPTTLGINAGAMVGVIAGQLLVVQISPLELSLWAFAGGGLTAIAVYGFAAWLGSSALNTILVGMALSLALGAVASGFLLFYENRLDGLFLWGAGSLSHLEYRDLASYAWPLLGLLTAALLFARTLSLFHLGDATAKTLGVPVSRIRAAALLLATAMASLCVSIAGVVSFIGLTAPHLARLLGARRQLSLAGLSALTGGAMLLLADVLARILGGHDYPLPAGAMTTLIGGPFLLLMLLRLSRQRIRLPEARETGLPAMFRTDSRLLLVLLAAVLCGLLWKIWPEHSAALSGAENLLLKLQGYRIIAAGLAGAALACSGLIFQILLRNPLASPDISGVTNVGILAVVITLSFMPAMSRLEFSLLSMLGSLLLLPVFYLLLRRPAYSPTHIALVGITLSAIAATLNTVLLTLGASQAAGALLWLSGTTYGVSDRECWLLLAVAGPLITLILWQARVLDILQFGNELAHSLAVRIRTQGLLMLIAACLLAAASVAVVGGIGFIGLMAPHIASVLGLSTAREKMIGSLLIGSALLIAADALAQSLMAPFEFSAGITTAVLGGGYFVLLLLSGKYRLGDQRGSGSGRLRRLFRRGNGNPAPAARTGSGL